MGWEKHFEWGDAAYPSLAKGMFCSIKDYPDSPPYSFRIEFQNGEIEIVTPQLVSSLLSILIYNDGDIIEVKDKVFENDKRKKENWEENLWRSCRMET